MKPSVLTLVPCIVNLANAIQCCCCCCCVFAALRKKKTKKNKTKKRSSYLCRSRAHNNTTFALMISVLQQLKVGLILITVLYTTG